MRHKFRWIMVVLILLVAITAMLPFGLRVYTDWRYQTKIYSLQEVPKREVAIIFGAQVTRRGHPSTMLADRVRTGIDLYQAGKVELLLMSGDNRRPDYDEPGVMRRMAIEMGIPPEAIITDPAGLRTYDTCHRARDVFGVRSAVLVTQNFHLDRALLTCDGLNLEAVGVAADYHRPHGYSSRAMGWSRWREIAATTIAFLDLVRRPDPSAEAMLPD